MVKPPVELGLPEYTTCLALLISELGNMLAQTENRKVSKIMFLAPLIGTDGMVKYDRIELKSDEDLKVM